MEITSPQNAHIKHLVKLRDDKSLRRSEGRMLVEGADEIRLARSAGHTPELFVVCPELALADPATGDVETLTVPRSLFQKLSLRDNPDGWLAVFPMPRHELHDLHLGPNPLLVIAESVEKPGNLGAILRTADAAGVDGLIVCDPRVDLYAPNVVRASRGACFTVPAVQTTNAQAREFLRRKGIRLVAATPGGQKEYAGIDFARPTAIAVGTEDEGLTPFWLDAADESIQIPMRGKVNSLNVSVATAILVYEALRQRRK